MGAREIGSEFWERLPEKKQPEGPDTVFLLSGRTAIDHIVRDIRCSRPLRSVLLPSYCCESMIGPFLANQVQVSFYRVEEDRVDYDAGNSCDAVLLLDYFGYAWEEMARIGRLAHCAGKIVIYDGTHRLGPDPSGECRADYSLYSYRKWFYCNYASVIKHRGSFEAEPPVKTHDAYIRLRDGAAAKKKACMEGRSREKAGYLAAYREAEDLLEREYAGFCGTPVEADVQRIIAQRRENAAFLMAGLRNVPQIRLWRSRVGEKDTPMFVPILVEEGRRDDLRQHLISRQIYCPVHWPLSACHEGSSRLYTDMLSLVCDQRYTLEDMERILTEIKIFFSRQEGEA